MSHLLNANQIQNIVLVSKKSVPEIQGGWATLDAVSQRRRLSVQLYSDIE